jgi:hypothetical protein
MSKKTSKATTTAVAKQRTRRNACHVNAKTLATAIDAQRHHLRKTGTIARSLATRLIETCDFVPGEPVLGFCLRVIEEILARANAVLDPAKLLPPSGGEPLDSMRLAKSVDGQREQLFRAQAVAQAVACLLLATDESEQAELDVHVVVSAIDRVLEEVITALEPLNLGLPIPGAGGSRDETLPA